MHYELNLRDYIRIFQKRKWTIILMPVLAGLLGYFLTPVPPVIYEAKGRMRVVSRSQPIDLMLQTFYYYEEGNRLDTHAEVMLSREVLKKVAMNLGLIDRTNPDGTPVTDADIAARADWVGQITRLRNAITPTVIEGTSILEVGCTLPNPQAAIELCNTLLDTYSEENDYQVNQEVIESYDFLRTRLEDVEDDLQESNRRLVDFMLANANRLSLGTDEIAATQRDIQQTQSRLINLQAAIAAIDGATADGMTPPAGFLAGINIQESALAGASQRLRDLDARRTLLLTYQTPFSPEVLEVEEEIRLTTQALRESLVRLAQDVEAERDRLRDRFLAMPANDAELDRLRAEVELNTEIHKQVRAQLEQAALADISKTREVQIIEHAIDAQPLTESGRASRALIAAMIGLLLGVVVALLVETLDTSIGAIEDVESLLNLSVIGIIPPIDFDDIRTIIRSTMPQLLDNPDIDHLTSLVTHYDPRSPVAEAYRALRTNVEKTREALDARTIMVTSSVLEEGKTTTSANLALAFAQMGRKTLLVAADLRRPDIHRVFGLQKEPGLADVLTGSMTWQAATRGLSDILLGELPMDIVMLTPGMDNLHVLPSGSNPLNPAELLSSRAMKDLMDELRENFDVVIIDTPPIIPVTDSAVLAEHTDGVVLVYEVGKVGRDVLKRAKSHFDNVGADIWGIVMNDVKAEAETTLRDTDYYYYHYRYEDDAMPPSSGVIGSLGRAASKVFGRKS
jgi:capsular exopolysaccharide synthesis family protein